jgi:NADH-quinone oxidoreductase subunit H
MMMSGTLNVVDIVESRIAPDSECLSHSLRLSRHGIAATAEVNRIPFDLPEAETELVAGYQTEYSSPQLFLAPMAEYINMLTVSAIASTMFLGGYQSPVPFLPSGIVWLMLKIAFFIFLLMWMRGTLPRFRYDQLMRFGWKVLLPLALLNILVTALGIIFIPSVFTR